MLLTPALLVLILSVVQSALWWHAAHLADAAAQRGAIVAAGHGATAGSGADAAQSFLAAAGATAAGAPSVTRESASVRATVSVRVPRLLPGFPAVVARTSVAPVERFIPEGER